MDKNRKYFYLDLLRLFAILCVIMLHIIMPFWENTQLFGTRIWHITNVVNTVSRTGVPLFFMVSGFLLLDNPKTLEFVHFYKRRMSKIVVPFFVWNVIYYCVYGAVYKTDLSIGGFLKEMLIEGTSYHFWFVYTLVMIYLFMPFLKRMLDGLSVRWCFVLLGISIFKTTIVPIINITTPLEIYLFDNVLNGYIGYVMLGYILGKFEFKRVHNVLFAIIALLGACITLWGNVVMSEGATNSIFNGGLQIGHFMLASGIFVLFKNVKKPSERMAKIVGTMSGITFGMYLVHPMVISGVSYYFSGELRPYIYISVIFVLTVIISALFSYLVSKIKYINKILL